ncbi:hypothetical protein FRB96_001646 [Tulasnella sp. 330]|nr:hypothetical protein FRB96_001646 [Tulasnella sp. 330]KAG8883567.1 hypothetical protein FRB98_003066 [Tulasnella sp. 332]
MDVDMQVISETRHIHNYRQLVVPMSKKRSRTPSSPSPPERPSKRLSMEHSAHISSSMSSRNIRSQPMRKHRGSSDGDSRERMIIDTMKVTYTWTTEEIQDDEQTVDEISPMRLPPMPTFRLHADIDPFSLPPYEPQLQLYTDVSGGGDPFLVTSSFMSTPRHQQQQHTTSPSTFYQPHASPPQIFLLPPTPHPRHPSTDAPPSPTWSPFEPLETMSPLGHKGRLDRRHTAP